MKEAGMSPEAIIVALECFVDEAPKIDPALERRRAADRERQARYRASKSEDVTLDNVTNVTSDEQKGFDKEIPHTPLEITSKKKSTIRARVETRPHPFPDDFQPDATNWQICDELGLTAQGVQDQIERMRDWAKNADGAKGRKKDWQAFFRNWIKRAANERQTPQNRPPARVQQYSRAANFDLLDRYVAEAERRDAEARGEPGEAAAGELPGLWQGTT